MRGGVFSKVAKILLRMLLVVTILDVTGGHWFVLQTIAWSQMVADYSRTASMKQALEETFDGQHPCEMCKSIQKAKQTEKKKDLQQGKMKREFVCEPHGIFLAHPPGHGWFQTVPRQLLFVRTQSPEVPPPRV